MPGDDPGGPGGDRSEGGPSGEGTDPRRTTVIAGVGETLGTALARAFAAASDRVVLVARSPEYVESLADEVGSDGGEALAVTADVTDPDAVRALFEEVRATWGGADVLVHNASAPGSGRIEGTDPAAFERPWRVRAFAGFLCAREFARDVERAERGPGGADGRAAAGGKAILFPGTSYAGEPSGRPAWDSAAHATRGLARSLAADLGPAGVHVAYLSIGAGIAPPDGYVTEDRLPARTVADRLVALADADDRGWTFERIPGPQ